MNSPKKAPKRQHAKKPTEPMVLVHHLAGMFNVLPGADNEHRMALKRINDVLARAALSDSAPDESVQRIIEAALAQSLAYERPEFWLLGACNAILTSVSAAPPAANSSQAGVGLFVALFRACAETARITPNPLPGVVSEEHAKAIAAACADHVLNISSQAMRASDPSGGSLQ